MHSLRVRKTLFICCLLVQSYVLFAQEQDRLNELTVDRPGIAEAPYTVLPKHFQFETGFDYYKRTNGEIYFLPVSLFRTGISKSAELRVTIKNIHDETSQKKLNGVSPLTVGIKTHIIKQDRWIPETDILADVIFPLGKSDLHPANLGHDLLLLFENDLSSKVALNYNVGLIWDGNTNQNFFTTSFCFNYLATDRTNFFMEYYNYLKSDVSEHGIDGGLTFLLWPLVQADLSAGISLVNQEPNHFISTGISFRLE